MKVKSVQCLSNRLIMKRLNSHGLTFGFVKIMVGLHVCFHRFPLSSNDSVLETQVYGIYTCTSFTWTTTEDGNAS